MPTSSVGVERPRLAAERVPDPNLAHREAEVRCNGRARRFGSRPSRRADSPPQPGRGRLLGGRLGLALGPVGAGLDLVLAGLAGALLAPLRPGRGSGRTRAAAGPRRGRGRPPRPRARLSRPACGRSPRLRGGPPRCPPSPAARSRSPAAPRSRATRRRRPRRRRRAARRRRRGGRPRSGSPARTSATSALDLAIDGSRVASATILLGLRCAAFEAWATISSRSAWERCCRSSKAFSARSRALLGDWPAAASASDAAPRARRRSACAPRRRRRAASPSPAASARRGPSRPAPRRAATRSSLTLTHSSACWATPCMVSVASPTARSCLAGSLIPRQPTMGGGGHATGAGAARRNLRRVERSGRIRRASRARSSRLRTLPVALRGSSSRNSISRGAL